jgi:hypothetical protein
VMIIKEKLLKLRPGNWNKLDKLQDLNE